MAYYRVDGEVRDYFEVYVEAKSKKEAIKKAEIETMETFDTVDVIRISKQDYEDYK